MYSENIYHKVYWGYDRREFTRTFRLFSEPPVGRGLPKGTGEHAQKASFVLPGSVLGERTAALAGNVCKIGWPDPSSLSWSTKNIQCPEEKQKPLFP